MSDFVLSENRRDDDARLDAPAFHRNGPAIVDALSTRLTDRTGVVLEVGSGSGQHIALFACSFPHLRFQPSDPNPAHRASIDAWRDHLGLNSIRPAISLDVSATVWGERAMVPAGGFLAIFCANVIHIAPWSVTEGLFREAVGCLAENGFLALYGPFRWQGRHISTSNEAFDANLRSRDPSWGVRDVDEIDQLAACNGLGRVDAVAMPSNNHLLVFTQEKT